MRKTKTIVVLITILAIALFFGSLFLADEDNTGEDELILARQAATSELAGYTSEDIVFPEFEGSNLVSSQPYYDLEGNLICYMFGIGSEGKILGTIVVGSSAYDNRILEVFNAPPPCVPSTAKVKESLETCLGIQVDETSIGEPERLLHLGPASNWALYNVNGQSVAVHLWTELAAQASDLKFTMSTPEQMRQYDEMRGLELTGGNSD